MASLDCRLCGLTYCANLCSWDQRLPDQERRRHPSVSLLSSASTVNVKETAMGMFSKDIKNLDDLFVHTLQDIYYAEQQIVKALPDMIEKATNRELTEG